MSPRLRNHVADIGGDIWQPQCRHDFKTMSPTCRRHRLGPPQMSPRLQNHVARHVGDIAWGRPKCRGDFKTMSPDM